MLKTPAFAGVFLGPAKLQNFVGIILPAFAGVFIHYLNFALCTLNFCQVHRTIVEPGNLRI